MFNQPVNSRLSAWALFRDHINQCDDPLKEVWEFWKSAPFIPYNNKIDPYYQLSWPSPWEIIVENKYDDFTKALMIGQTLRLTPKFQKAIIEIKTLIDNANARQYNIVCVDNIWAINFKDCGPVPINEITCTLVLENLIELTHPR